MKKENGIASLLHGPGRVTTSLGGGIVTLCEETDYPYSGRITIRIVEGGGMFPIFVRVPRWAKCDDAGGFRKFERVWKAGDKIEINFPMAIELSFWDRNALCVRRGPLIYALKQEALWRKIEKYTIPYEKKQIVDFGGEFPRWEILSKTPWNYALVLDKNGKLKDARVVDGAQGTEIRLRARRTNAAGWGHLRMDAPARAIDPPHSPLAADVCGEDVEISLVPLGKTQIRVTLFPWLEE